MLVWFAYALVYSAEQFQPPRAACSQTFGALAIDPAQSRPVTDIA
jgi:hypothetical protein